MNKPRCVVVSAAFLLCIGLNGCSKQQDQPAPSATATPAAPAEAPKVQAPAPQPASVEVPKVEASTAPASAPQAVADTGAQAQGLIDKIKGLIAKTDYSSALNSLKELSALKLTPEQQKMMDDLSQQVQQLVAGATASDATKKASEAVGGLLGK